MAPSPTRRSFLRSMLLAGSAPLILPSRLRGATAPSDQLTLGFIGTGWHGMDANLPGFLQHGDCRVRTVCDVFAARAEAAQEKVNQAYENGDCHACRDFREVLADPAIDAVVISTPDHWHVPMSLMALAAGKHVFCEKPTLAIAEGRVLADAVQKSGLTFQAGIEDRSLVRYHRLVEWVRNGAIGDLQHIDVTMPPGSIHPGEEPAPVPDGLDWNLWLGPAPFHPFTPTRAEAMHWRYIRDYSTGVLTDWGCHLIDTAQLAANDPLVCPVTVEGWGEAPPPGAQSDIPAQYDVRYRYANGVTMRVRHAVDEEWMGAKASLHFQGSTGWVSITGWQGTLDASDPAILRTRYEPAESAYVPRPPREHRNFLDGVRSGRDTTYTAEILHHLSTTCHLGLIAMDLGRTLHWDPLAERFVDDDEANRRRHRELREDWKSA